MTLGVRRGAGEGPRVGSTTSEDWFLGHLGITTNRGQLKGSENDVEHLLREMK